MMGGETECKMVPCCGWSAANCCNWSFILIPSVAYFLVVFIGKHGFPIPLIMASVVLFIATVTFLCLACCSDPGILPRRGAIIAENSEEVLTKMLGYNPLGVGEPTHKADVDSHGMVPKELTKLGYRWCHTCEIIRPPRASHCAECDNCVLRFDHHCPFVNNCVGQRNYHFFIGFTTSVCCLAILVLPSLAWFYLDTRTTRRGFKKAEEPQEEENDYLMYGLFVIACIVGIAALALVGLWCYHMFLISQGKTTKEHRKGKQVVGLHDEPTFCAPRGPPLFNPLALVDGVKLRAEVSCSIPGHTRTDAPACGCVYD